SSISLADTLRHEYLPGIFKDYLVMIKQIFSGKRVSVIVNETTDSRAQSIVNILFNYRELT
ncbi:32642_t:CDS:1, partial [Gigaspora margarita]